MAKKVDLKNEQKFEFLQYIAAIIAGEIAKTIYRELAFADKKFGKLDTSDIVLMVADAIAQTIEAMGEVFGIEKDKLAGLLCDAIKQIINVRSTKEEEENERK